jgi:NAD(P)H-dependent FMN reductase
MLVSELLGGRMFFIPVILGTVRRNRQSARVAQFVLDRLNTMECVSTELLDLQLMDLPFMEERLRFNDNPPPSVVQFSAQMCKADSVVIVTPEYNNSYPGVLKNALDYLKDEYKHKPFGIVTVSSSGCGGILCLASLRQVILHLGGVPIPAALPVPHVQDKVSASGVINDCAITERADLFFDELLWFTEALSNHRNKHVNG